jgi:hypothetical protein
MATDELAKLQAPEEPRSALGRDGEQPQWSGQVQVAMEARRMGARLRRGKLKSFRPVVGEI